MNLIELKMATTITTIDIAQFYPNITFAFPASSTILEAPVSI